MYELHAGAKGGDHVLETLPMQRRFKTTGNLSLRSSLESRNSPPKKSKLKVCDKLLVTALKTQLRESLQSAQRIES